MSSTAAPSRRNSGFEQSPKPLPHFFPDSLSNIGLTTALVVPGVTVLLRTTVCLFLLKASCFPTMADAAVTCERSMEPSDCEGVPTAMRMTSAPWMES